MLEPGGFATDNLFPAGKSNKTRCFPYETPDSEKALARSSFVLEATCGGFDRKRLQFLEAPMLIARYILRTTHDALRISLLKNRT